MKPRLAKGARYACSTRHLTYILLLAQGWMVAACGDCSSGPGTIKDKKGEKLVWEEMALGIDEGIFYNKAVSLRLIDTAVDRKHACQDEFILSVPVLEEGEIVERSAGKHHLTSCVFRPAVALKSPALLEIRGEFVDTRLSRLSYRLKPTELDSVKKSIEQRFGKGANIVLEEQLMIEGKKGAYQLWKEENEVWLLSLGEQNTVLLVHQDLKAGLSLPAQAKAGTRGEPVSLEDIGIGKLDLKAPEPLLDLPDSGPIAAPR